jgi:hypothetical protein
MALARIAQARLAAAIPVVLQCHATRTTTRAPFGVSRMNATVHSHSEESIAETLSVRIGGIELGLAADAPLRLEPQPLKRCGRQGMSFLRPLARRLARTLRPFFVAMRARNP